MITVSLTTDWGNLGLYSGLFKAKLLQRVEQVQIVDITHSVTPFKVEEAAIILRNSYRYFPENSIHILCVSSMNVAELWRNNEYICFEYRKQFFIGPNNGLWQMVFDELPEHVYKITVSTTNIGHGNFAEADAFVEVIRVLSQGKLPQQIGEEIVCLQGRHLALPQYDSDSIIATFMYFDTYGNGITNISRELFYQVGKNRPFRITVSQEKYYTDKIDENYNVQNEGIIIALFSVLGFVEIAVPYARLENYLPVSRLNSVKVHVQFFDNESDKNSFSLF